MARIQSEECIRILSIFKLATKRKICTYQTSLTLRMKQLYLKRRWRLKLKKCGILDSNVKEWVILRIVLKSSSSGDLMSFLASGGLEATSILHTMSSSRITTPKEIMRMRRSLLSAGQAFHSQATISTWWTTLETLEVLMLLSISHRDWTQRQFQFQITATHMNSSTMNVDVEK